LSREVTNRDVDWFEEGSDAALIRETFDHLAVWDDVDRWLERLRLVREMAKRERAFALDKRRRDRASKPA
jgi:hypothetical protein